MNLQSTFLIVTAHPDDEAVLLGGTIREIVAHGGTVHLCVLTRGEKGIQHLSHTDNTCPVTEIRALELESSAGVLGISSIVQGDFPDGELARVEPSLVHTYIASVVKEFMPDALITFGPTPYYPHSDHITTRLRVLEALSLMREKELWNGDVFLHILPEENQRVLTEMRKGRKATTGVYAEGDDAKYQGIVVETPVSDASFEEKLRAVGQYHSQHPENFIHWLRKFPLQNEYYINLDTTSY